jgi:hypothetical protein
MQDAWAGDLAAPGPGDRPAIGAGPGAPYSGRSLRMGFVLDVAGYAARSVPERDEVQRVLLQLVVSALGACGLALDAGGVDHQWTGDGINAVLPAVIDPTAVLALLIRSLAAGLRTGNAARADRVRLRMAIGIGLFERSAAGFGGPLVVEINRLVNSAALRSALAATPSADLTVAVSEQVHALVIAPGYPGIPRGQFTRMSVTEKEFSGPAWQWMSSRQWSGPAYQPLAVSDPREEGPYRIAARLGAGPSSLVYLASGEAGWAAVKVFDRQLTADPDVRRRLADGITAWRATRTWPRSSPPAAQETETGIRAPHGWRAPWSADRRWPPR